MDVQLHPKFADNRLVYLTYHKAQAVMCRRRRLPVVDVVLRRPPVSSRSRADAGMAASWST